MPAVSGASPETIGLAAVIVLGVAAQWLSNRLRIPSILLLLGIGLVAGPGTGWLNPDGLFGALLAPFVAIAVALILFEGGLTLRLAELRTAGWTIARLILLGAAVSFAITLLAAQWILGFGGGLAALLAAILVVTGPTVIVPLLAAVRPSGKVASVLKWEGILIDPVGAVAAVLVFEAVWAGAHEPGRIVLGGVLRTLGVGIAGGALGAAFIVIVMRRYWVPDTLRNPVVLMVVIAAYVLSNMVQPEAGLLAVTLMGVALANQRIVDIHGVMEFKESLRVLLISTLFILLAARLDARELARMGWREALFLTTLIAIGRPLAVLVSTIGSRLSRAERIFLAGVAPRGIVAAAVASVFSLRLGPDVPGAERLVPVIFLVIIGTVAIYGLGAGPLARRLGLTEPSPQGILFIGAHAWGRAVAAALQREGVRVLVADSNWENISAARMEGLPVYYGNALAHSAIEEMDLSRIGRMIAWTSNDAVNGLACRHYLPVFGRANVFQLPPRTVARRDEMSAHLQGRLLFGPDATFAALDALWKAGARVRATALTREFGYDDLIAKEGNRCVPLFVLTPQKRVEILEAHEKPRLSGRTDVVLIHLSAEHSEEGSTPAGVSV
jgi:NhaP-type Na+/H+ or K+/H+ antiporter